MLGRPFDKFIRQENLGHDLKSLPFIDLDVPEIKRNFEENISQNIYENEFENIIGEKRKNWKDFYDEETSDFVFETLKEQFDLFGYKKNSWNNGTP